MKQPVEQLLQDIAVERLDYMELEQLFQDIVGEERVHMLLEQGMQQELDLEFIVEYFMLQDAVFDLQLLDNRFLRIMQPVPFYNNCIIARFKKFMKIHS